ncbi:MAG: glutathione peroxidase [Brevundimonas sp.]|jgi:glutathione peroxidase|uniref:glutathione peroxidase n=1 Tax=Brevundimonas sp. TaxID=1871086 RepID=UPI0039E6F0F5
MSRISLTGIALIAALAACDRAEPAAETETAQAEEQELAPTEAVNAAVAEHQALFAAAPPVEQAPEGTAYRFAFDGLSTPNLPMTAFQGDVVLVVNTASKCGFTPQYEGLQTLYEEYGGQGFAVVGVPSGDFLNQELENADEIREFCTLNFGVTFPMAGRTRVTGDDAHPFYQWARAEMGDDAVPGWNFHKLLIDRQGRLIAAFPSATTPTADEVRQAIEGALSA